jgi:hypothetical protein
MNRESRPKSRRAFRSARGLHHHFDRSEWQQYAGRHPSIPVNSVAEFVAREPIQYALETDWPVEAADGVSGLVAAVSGPLGGCASD